MKHKAVLFAVSFLLASHFTFAQVAVAYYPFQSEISISTDTENTVWGDLRIQANTFFAHMNLEPSVMVNVSRQTHVNYYLGAGVNLNFFNPLSDLPLINGYAFDVGARIKPFTSYPGVQLIFEIAPYVNYAFDSGLLNARLGIGYQF
ncbi:hypothetical protein [Phaeocystidibacter luteus]|uniref:Porin family protein n=1 Tax=Phaeocystidibacter luteus TaxID=911197 RepID=A0A6N6RFV8_9FLAO|nr:hypothetical protein [Phaeocystidibacter luteus]KAB2810064.1 hypothetical protein F8C67_07455 [Phaeocystidibacter luteus]